jgi:hypothetical protein
MFHFPSQQGRAWKKLRKSKPKKIAGNAMLENRAVPPLHADLLVQKKSSQRTAHNAQ